MLTATTGNDSLVGGDTNTNFVMSQGEDEASIPSGSLGGTDTVNGGGGIDQITFDNLWQVSGRLDAATSKLYLWNWSDNTPLDPGEAPTGEAATTVGFTSVELFYFGSYDGTEELQLPSFALGDQFVGEAIAGGEGADFINAFEDCGGMSSLGWFANVGAVLASGGGGNDVIYGGSFVTKLSGGAGNDQLYVSEGSLSWLEGGEGDDTLSNGATNATMYGDDGDDIFKITDAASNNAIFGGGYKEVNGNTVLVDDGTADRVIYSELDTSVTFTLSPAIGASRMGEMGNGSDILLGIEYLVGTNNGDLYNFTGAVDSALVGVEAGEGNDTFDIGVGAAVAAAIDGGQGHDTFQIHAGATVAADISGAAGLDTLVVSGQGITIGSVSDIETITGSEGDDSLTLNCSADDQSFDFGDGTDTLTLAEGGTLSVNNLETLILADVEYDPEEGEGEEWESEDSLTLQTTVSGLTVNMGNGQDALYLSSEPSGETGFDHNDVTVVNVEEVNGSGANDTVTFAANLTADDEVQVDLSGEGDNDTVNLAAGANTLNISNVEMVIGSASADSLTLTDSLSYVTIDLGGGTDVIYLAEGENSLAVVDVETVAIADGDPESESDDSLTFEGVVAGVSVDLGDGFDDVTLASVDDGEGGFEANQVTLVNVEAVVGSEGDDTVTFTANLDGEEAVEVDLGSGENDTVHLAAGANNVYFGDVESVIGSGGNDQLTLADTVSGMSINLGSGTDVLNLYGGSNEVTLANVETVNGSDDGDNLTFSDSVVGTTVDLDASSDTLTLADGGNSLTVIDVEAVYGGEGADQLTIDGESTADVMVRGGAGIDTITNQGEGALTLRYNAIGDFGDIVNGFIAGTDAISIANAIPVSYPFSGPDGPGYGYLAISQATLDQGPYLCEDSIINLTTGFAGYNDASTVATKLANLHGSSAGWDALVVSGDGTNSQVWYWSDTSGNSQVGADELTAVAKLNGCSNTGLGASDFEFDTGTVT